MDLSSDDSGRRALSGLRVVDLSNDLDSVEVTALGGTRPERIKLLADLGVTRMLLLLCRCLGAA